MEVTFYKQGEFLKETPRLSSPPFNHIDHSAYHKAVTEYKLHLSSLRSIPIWPGLLWKKTKQLIEGIDFYFSNPEFKIFAVPLHVPLPVEESQKVDWNDAISEANEHYVPTAIHRTNQVLAYLTKHFTLHRIKQ